MRSPMSTTRRAAAELPSGRLARVHQQRVGGAHADGLPLGALGDAHHGGGDLAAGGGEFLAHGREVAGVRADAVRLADHRLDQRRAAARASPRARAARSASSVGISPGVERAQVAGAEAVGGAHHAAQRRVDGAHHHEDGAEPDGDDAPRRAPRAGCAATSMRRGAAAAPAARWTAASGEALHVLHERDRGPARDVGGRARASSSAAEVHRARTRGRTPPRAAPAGRRSG